MGTGPSPYFIVFILSFLPRDLNLLIQDRPLVLLTREGRLITVRFSLTENCSKEMVLLPFLLSFFLPSYTPSLCSFLHLHLSPCIIHELCVLLAIPHVLWSIEILCGLTHFDGTQ